MAVMKPIWRTVWPPRCDPNNGDEERIARLQRTPREKWTSDDWRTWAEFLEWRGGLLADELNKVRTLASDLAEKVPKPTRRGPKPKPGPMTIAGGLLGLVRVPIPRTKGAPGRRADQDAAEQLAALRLTVEARMSERGIMREPALRELLREEYPRWRKSRIEDEARKLSRRLSRPVKPAR